MGELSGLIKAAHKGDSDAFEEVLRRFQDMAVGYAYAMLGDWQEAEDAAQEAFIAAWVGLVNLRDPAAFPGWFRRIMYTKAQRRLRVKGPLLVSLEQVGEIAVGDQASGLAPSPAADALAAALETLPEAQRAVVLLHYMNDYRQSEIADFLDIPIGTVKSRLYHARQSLKERMRVLSDISGQRPSRDSQFTEKVMRLFDAAKTGDGDIVSSLLAEDSRLGQARGYVRTSLWGSDALALHVAVMHGRVDIVDLLLAHGADINARDDKYRFNALIHAIDLADFMPEYAALGMVDFLLERGAEKDVWACAWLGDMAGVKERLDENPALVNEIGPGPSTLLSFCRDVRRFNSTWITAPTRCANMSARANTGVRRRCAISLIAATMTRRGICCGIWAGRSISSGRASWAIWRGRGRCWLRMERGRAQPHQPIMFWAPA